jgi:hypothetical protein
LKQKSPASRGAFFCELIAGNDEPTSTRCSAPVRNKIETESSQRTPEIQQIELHRSSRRAWLRHQLHAESAEHGIIQAG